MEQIIDLGIHGKHTYSVFFFTKKITSFQNHGCRLVSKFNGVLPESFFMQILAISKIRKQNAVLMRPYFELKNNCLLVRVNLLKSY